MKTKHEILEILGEDVVTYYYIKLHPTSDLMRLEVIVKNLNYCQIKMLTTEILWIVPDSKDYFKIVFSEWQVEY